MTTNNQNEKIGEWIQDKIELSMLDYKYFIEDVIADGFEPEEVFSQERLKEWAIDNDFIETVAIDEESEPAELCDRNCNECPVIFHPNSRMLTRIINELYDRFGDGVLEIVNNLCCNMTVCYDCRIDDFIHVEGCNICPEE